MSLDRRRQLLAWSKQNDVLVIEDAVDSDFRYGSQPLPPLYKLDDDAMVICLYSFWKTLFPLTGISCLVLPPRLIGAFEITACLSRHSMPINEAMGLTELLQGGHLERHIRKAWSEYTKRRQALIFALAQNFRSSVTCFKESAGLHLLVRFRTEATEEQLLVYAAEAKLPMVSTQDWYVDTAEPKEFLISFALLSAKQIGAAVGEFADKLNSLDLQGTATTLSTCEVMLHPSTAPIEHSLTG